tara:strand:+ start:2680 stop:3072 length:393 start_codon:yes stop_codon:yes gene_type:complete
MAQKGLHKYTVQESQNFQVGQGPSVFLDTGSTITPAPNMVFVAVQIVQDAKFNDLVAEHPDYCFGTTGVDAGSGSGSDSDAYTGDLTGRIGHGTGDRVTSTSQFPSGMVIYGRWTSIDLSAGIIVAYQGS